MALEISEVKEGCFIEIKISEEKEHKGLWKVVNVEKDLEDEVPYIRMTLDRDTSISGDEIFAEIYPTVDETSLFILVPFDAFPEEEAEEWPPPETIAIGDIEYYRFDGQEGQCWEYQNDDETKFLQILSEEGYVNMYTGYQLNTGFIEIT